MQEYIIEKGLAQIAPTSELASLHNLQKRIGAFLVGDFDLIRSDPRSVWYTFEVRIYNPVDGEKVLHIRHAALNWSGLDEPVLYPVLNAVLDWINENK
jgi:hypothetical protein